jgi:hypothetical protein
MSIIHFSKSLLCLHFAHEDLSRAVIQLTRQPFERGRESSTNLDLVELLSFLLTLNLERSQSVRGEISAEKSAGFEWHPLFDMGIDMRWSLHYSLQ